MQAEPEIGVDEFSTFTNLPSCSVVQTLNFEERCAYVRSTPECLERKFYINYMNLFYCSIDPRSNVEQVFGTMALLLIITIMFVILGNCVDKFFCPALMVLSKSMGLNQQMAGVTMLAFGNGSPDLFTSLAGVNDTSRLLFNDLFGAAIYVSCFVGGMICLLHPFEMSPYNILRDIGFFILAILFIDYAIISGGGVTILESSCSSGALTSFSVMLCIYFIYMVVVAVDQLLLKRYVARLEVYVKRHYRPADVLLLETMRAEAGIELFSRTSRVSINVELTRKISYDQRAEANEKLFPQFFRSLNPIQREEWLQSNCITKVALIIKIPVKFLLQLHIPIVDYEEDRHGWSKLLNTIQIVLLPCVTGTIMTNGQTLYGVPISLYTLFFTLPLSIFVFCTTRTDIPPHYHSWLGCYGVFGSVFVIYSCANETVQILFVLGIVTFSSNSFLGCTLLAWGNSIGDLVANVALARFGYQRMGYAACYGGPFFNSVMAMGCTFLYRTIISEDNVVVVSKGPLGENVLVFILLIFSTTLVWSILTDFHARRCTGVFNLLLYVLFFLYTILSETEVIQSYGGDQVS